MNRRLGNLFVWMAMLGTILVLAWQFDATRYFGSGRLRVVEEGADRLVFRWQGPIEPPMADRIAEAFEEWRGKGREITLSLSSGGGSVQHGAEVVAVLVLIKRTHRLDTYVGPRDNCLSMCVAVFLQGEQRIAAPDARFMFHEVSAHDLVSRKRLDVPREETDRATTRLIDRFFRPAGVSEDWLKDLRRHMTGRDHWRTARQLVEERSGIVTGLE